ncbi:hypothetical protein G5X37_004641 [Salmonella enterica]|nr:hypothetical protein [Salmonella enterica]EEN6079953.1 hypothetical protein [Salmonella enterica]
MKTKITAALLMLVSLNAVGAITCGPFEIVPQQYDVRVNGDPVTIAGRRFTAPPKDYDNVVISLRRASITDKPFMFVLTAFNGRVSLEYITNEKPPRVLNRADCNSSLRGFDW